MIRRCGHRDLGRILEIEAKSFPKSAYNLITFLYFSRLYPDSFLVYEKSGRVCGYIIFDQKNGHILSIAVDPEYRRTGIGREFMREVFAKCGSGWVEVRTKNEVAKAFYKQLGFIVEGVIRGYYNNDDALVMVFQA
ncbi:MAG: putative N-acetyltransferase [Candidatus Syntrophoarchaeum sp. GoM_oil]|nr:MAG: putative N-acetyltransferase [Candidatus Syntrophoarchaeum sp. GoM_oil]